MVNKFQSERFDIAIKHHDQYHKVLQILFGKNDGSLFVNFPFFLDSKGLLSVLTMDKDGSLKRDLSLSKNGKVTSQLVKYSHHPDGMTLFSQDQKVYTVIKKRSIPLEIYRGHIFTVTIQGIKGYKVVRKPKDVKYSEKQMLLTFDTSTLDDDTFKIVGRWYSDVEALKLGLGADRTLITGTIDGKIQTACLLAAPVSYPLSNYTLLITVEGVPTINKELDTSLTFIGGFDSPDVVFDHDKKTDFLALIYPASNYDELLTRIGSIDFK